MAIRKMTDGVSQWNNKIFFPKNRYVLKCVEESFAPSSAGNPMVTRKFEIHSPAIIEVGEKKVNVAGLAVIQYRTTKVKDKDTGDWNAESSDKCWGSFRDELLAIGADSEMEIDDENPPLLFKGKTVDAIVSSIESVACQSPTLEQRRKGMKQGDPILDADGNEIKTYKLNLESILGLSSEQ